MYRIKLNRRIRIRTYGGVRGREVITPSYSILQNKQAKDVRLRVEYVIEMLDIRKEFPGVVANDNITLQVKKGEIHAVLGENGAGKSTLMNVLFGLYQPEKGEIRIKGKKVNISNPNVANELGIGMVHQHFMPVEPFTVTQNIILWSEPTKYGLNNLKEAEKEVQELSDRYGLRVDPKAKIRD